KVNSNTITFNIHLEFITDAENNNIPVFLMILHGVIDSPDIPINVSRSFLQTDSNVKKINTYITKKVADKLAEMAKKDREDFQNKWEYIDLFVKYGMITDDKFYDKAKDFALLKNVEGKYFTLNEYKDEVSAMQTDKDSNIVYLYANAPAKQNTFIKAAQKKGYDVVELSSPIDNHFIAQWEQKAEKTNIKRVDADTI